MTTIRFIQHDGREQVVDAANGESVMDAANDHGVPGIAADCGGCLSCATCHVYIPEDWLNCLDAVSEGESAMLKNAMNPQPNSRLSCQIIVNDSLAGLIVKIPKAQF